MFHRVPSGHWGLLCSLRVCKTMMPCFFFRPAIQQIATPKQHMKASLSGSSLARALFSFPIHVWVFVGRSGHLVPIGSDWWLLWPCDSVSWFLTTHLVVRYSCEKCWMWICEGPKFSKPFFFSAEIGPNWSLPVQRRWEEFKTIFKS